MERTQTTAEICDEFDVSEVTLKRWIKRGCPCDRGGKGKPRVFDAAEVAAWMKGNGATGAKGRPEETSDELKRAKIRKENALAEKHELAVAREKGLLVLASEVEQRNIQKITTVRNRLLGLGASLSQSLVGLDAVATEATINQHISEILQEFSQ